MNTDSSRLFQSGFSTSRLHQSNMHSSRLFQSGFQSSIEKSAMKILPKDIKEAESILTELRNENKAYKRKRTQLAPRMSEIEPEQFLKRAGVLTVNDQPRKTKRQSIKINREEVEKVFKAIDPNSEGYQLTYDKYLEKFHKFRFCLTKEEFNILSEDSDYVDMDTLLELVENFDENQNNLTTELFRDLADDENGYLDIDMVENSMKKLGLYCFNKTEDESVLKFMDYDNDGKISLNDFHQFWSEMNTHKL